MKPRYNPRDYLHYGRMVWRNRRRQQLWQRQFEAAVRNGTFHMSSPAAVTIIPTETCNLRCPMCNQWGENGYFLNGARPAQHMDEAQLVKLMRSFSPQAAMINIHGGEPFSYKHIGTLLELLREQQFDVLITTNGTLLERHVRQLAEIENLALLLSIDGDESTHDRIRGQGNFQRSRQGLAALFEQRRRRALPLPLVVMGFVVCEWTTDAIQTAYEVACGLGVFALNYTLRYFMPEAAGLAYEKHLQEYFELKSSGAWRGWVAPRHEQHDYASGAATLARLVRQKRFQPWPPYVFTLPRKLRGRDLQVYFEDYVNVFGNESCFMPFQWARVHSNGDLIYCPGHPDIVAGNVFRDDFMAAFNSETSIKFRRHILHNRLPICNRCCGLYMNYSSRPYEQKARQRLGLGRQVTVHFP
jgi:MoaA/NifB/PqqE/SkfB family radical SAM enzyme